MKSIDELGGLMVELIEAVEEASKGDGDKYRDTLDMADTMQHVADQHREQLTREKWEGGK